MQTMSELPNQTGGGQFAGFWIRAGAQIIDGLILFIPNIALSFVVAAMMGTPAGAMGTPGAGGANAVNNILMIIMYCVYFSYFTAGKWQATPGKRVCGIYVERADGTPLSMGRAVGRYFASILSGLILFIGYIMVAFTREKTGLHDLICETRVRYGKK